MNTNDIRWIQRFVHFTNALAHLRDAVALSRQRPLTLLEEQGLIQAFEFTHELAWNTVKDFLEHQGLRDLYGSRDTTRAGFKHGLLDDGETWMQMIASRNVTSHAYDASTVSEISSRVRERYLPEFEALHGRLAPLTTLEER
jgi:nucleotidyltransferase substrate binding protein (TIGR01987 family)